VVAVSFSEGNAIPILGTSSQSSAATAAASSTTNGNGSAITVRPTRAASAATPRGRLAEPNIIEVAQTSNEAVHDGEWWSKKTAEEALQLLADPQSGIGTADMQHWTPLLVNT
jgi:hypothetical protein